MGAVGNFGICCGKAEEIFYDGEGRETERLLMDLEAGSYGCVVPAGSWHTYSGPWSASNSSLK